MFVKRTDDFQLLKLERKPRSGGVTDALYIKLVSSLYISPFNVLPIDMQEKMKAKIREVVGNHDSKLLISVVSLSHAHERDDLVNTHLSTSVNWQFSFSRLLNLSNQ